MKAQTTLHLFCFTARHHIRNENVNKLVNNTAWVASFCLWAYIPWLEHE